MPQRKRIEFHMIIAAAVTLADTDGLQAVTMASLARQLRIKPPSLYNHVKNLSEIQNEVTLYSLQQLYGAMTEKTKNEQAFIFRISEAYIQFAREHPGLYQATLKSLEVEDERIKEASDQILKLVLESISHLNLERETAIHAVRGIRSMLHGFTSLEHTGSFGIPLDINKSLHYSLNVFLEGLNHSRNSI